MPDENDVPDEIVKQLYQVSPERFVAERTRLVKESKDAGDKEKAAAIGRLRRPPASAWALARVAADDPDSVEELLAANQHLRAAMAGGGRGGGERFRQASNERLHAVSRLTDRASAALEDAGIAANRTVLERIETTLMATATDEAGADLLRRGVLDRDLVAGGFADLFSAGGESAAGDAPEAKGDETGTEKTAAAEAKRRDRLEREARQRQDEARAAEEAAAAAERDAEVADRAAEAAVKAASVKRKDAERLSKDAERARERARAAVDRLGN